MRASEYEKPPRATKEMIAEFEKKAKLPDRKHEKTYTAPILDKPAKTKLKSENIFMEQQR